MLADCWDVGEPNIKAVIGERPMTLYGDYHPDQEWFPFMNGVILDKGLDWDWGEGPPRTTGGQRKWMEENADKPARVPSHLRHLYRLYADQIDHRAMHHQDILPFAELKLIKNESVFRYLVHTFDEGDLSIWGFKLLGIRIYGSFDKMEQWVLENTKGRVYISRNHWAIFQKTSDWMHAKMAFAD